MKRNGIPLILAAMVAAALSRIQGGEMSSPELVGTTRSVLDAGTSAMRPGQSVGGNAGGGIQGVNLYTGQPSYSISLGAISTPRLSFPITLTYSGPTKPMVQNDNERAPTSWVGLGFNLSMPYVSVNHKGTYTGSDDVFFCDLGPYGGGQLLSDDGVHFFLSTNPYIEVSTDTGLVGTPEAGQHRTWTFRFPDGKVMAFGENGYRRSVFYHGGLIRAPMFLFSPEDRFTYRWDLSTFSERPPTPYNRGNVITFEYDYIPMNLILLGSYIREGYIKNIKWSVGGKEVERYEFSIGPKNPNEYVGYANDESRNDQKLFETQRLDMLKCFKEGSLTHAYKFDWTPQSKRLLSAVRILHPHPVSGAWIQDSGWSFNYDANRYFLLNRIITPSSRKDSLIYGKVDFHGTYGDQDATDYVMLRQDNATEVPLPSGSADRAAWSVDNTCDERFCYTVVRDGDSQSLPGDTYLGAPFSKKAYVEIKRNTGNYFDSRATEDGEKVTLRLELGNPTDGENDWKILPMGDYLLVVGEKSGKVDVWEYDGVRWTQKQPFSGDPHWNGGFGSPIRVYPSSNYFVVQKLGVPSVLVVALRTSQGWTSLNRSTCQFSNKDDYGEPIRASRTGSECLEWSSPDIVVTVAQNFFSVMNSYNEVFCVYALQKHGNAFMDISAKFAETNGPEDLRLAEYPMNWSRDVVSVVSNGDNLFIQSAGPWVHGFYWDGDELLETMSQEFPGSGPVVMFPSRNYLLVAEPKGANGTIDFFPKRMLSEGTPYFFGTDKKIVRSDWNSAWKLQVRTHPKAFSVEYYPDQASVGLRPKWESSASNYRSYLYQVNRAFVNGFVSRTGQLSQNGFSLFNISFSGSDDVLTGTSASKVSGTARCDENPTTPCDIDMYSARFHPEDTTTFINNSSDKYLLDYNSQWRAPKQSQSVLSNCARLMMRTTLDTVTSPGRVRSRYFQYGGMNYRMPDTQYVVTDVISSAALTGEDKNQVRNHIAYASNGESSDPVGAVEFNTHLQVPQFEFADVSPSSAIGITEKARTYFNLDSYDNKLTGKRASLRGTVKERRTLNSLRQTIDFSQVVSEPYRKSNWPEMLYINRTRSRISKEGSVWNGYRMDTTYFLGYCDTNGAPRFILRNSRPEKMLLTQNVYDASGNATRTMAFNLSSQPDTLALRTWQNNNIYPGNPVSATKTVFNNYDFLRDSIWIEKDQSLADADLRSGRTPVFNWSEGWFPANEVTQRDDSSFQIMERKVVKNGLPGAQGERYTSNFFEGLRYNPVATVSNAKLSDCAVLMAENGNAGFTGNRLDYRNKWENAGGSFTNIRSHTGRYSIKVQDNWGPTINLYLKDVRALGYDFKISAWIYSESGTPVMAINRYQSGGGYLDGVPASPVSGSAGASKVWQRWEARISNAQLIAGNKFNGDNDYLRMCFGLGGATGNSARVVYVDDIVCLPSTADFNLATYDKNGTTTSVTGGNFLPTYFDIGFKGNVIAVRDDKFRIFSQNAVHKMGEN